MNVRVIRFCPMPVKRLHGLESQLGNGIDQFVCWFGRFNIPIITHGPHLQFCLFRIRQITFFIVPGRNHSRVWRSSSAHCSVFSICVVNQRPSWLSAGMDASSGQISWNRSEPRLVALAAPRTNDVMSCWICRSIIACSWGERSLVNRWGKTPLSIGAESVCRTEDEIFRRDLISFNFATTDCDKNAGTSQWFTETKREVVPDRFGTTERALRNYWINT